MHLPKKKNCRKTDQADKQALYTQRETRNYWPEIWKDSDF